MASEQKIVNASNILTDVMGKLDVSTIGIASLADWKTSGI